MMIRQPMGVKVNDRHVNQKLLTFSNGHFKLGRLFTTNMNEGRSMNTMSTMKRRNERRNIDVSRITSDAPRKYRRGIDETRLKRV